MSEIKISKEVSEIKSKIKELNLGQISELIEGLKVDYNIQETAVVQSAVTTQESEKSEEKNSNVSIKLVEMGSEKIKIWKEIVNIVKEQKGEVINPIHAKKLTEKEDKIILEDIPRDKAEGEKGIKKRLEDLGAKVEIVY
jgi:ribosomal protein L7/L12